MTCLIRCRAATSEIAALFEARPDPGLVWFPTIWPGDKAPVITTGGKERRIHALNWGLPENIFIQPRPPGQRGTLFAREITGGRHSPILLEQLERCLIAVEDMAYPHGEEDERMRCWLGLWDTPIAAWAGLCLADAQDGGFAGLLTTANARADPVSRTMPILLAPSQWEAWLSGAALHALDAAYDIDAFYLERTPELWGSGRVSDE